MTVPSGSRAVKSTRIRLILSNTIENFIGAPNIKLVSGRGYGPEEYAFGSNEIRAQTAPGAHFPLRPGKDSA